MEQLAQWDRELFVYLNTLNTGFLDNFWLVVTQIENWIPLYLIIFILFWKNFTQKKAMLAIMLTFSTLATILVLTGVVKSFVGRLRPSNTPELETLIRVLQTPTDFSFWSGHAATSMAITVFVVSVLKHKMRWSYLFFIWPFLFTTSRIFVGVHYPSDLLVGATVGTVIGLFFYKLFTSLNSRLMP